MSGTLALSSVIASLDRQALTELVYARRIASPAGVNDPLDLAVELLRTDSITQALTELTRSDLIVLAQLTAGATLNEVDQTVGARLRALALAASGALPEVSSALGTLLSSRGLELADLLTSSESAAAVSSVADPAPADTSSWFASALTATAEVAWLLRQLRRAPAKLNRNGGVASAWQRFLEESFAITRADELAQLARAANLAVTAQSTLLAHADDWLATDSQERWVSLAEAAVRIMPQQVRDLLRGTAAGQSITPVLHSFPEHYPLVTDATSQLIERAAKLWERLGLTVDGALSEAGAHALRAVEAGGSAAHTWPDLGLPSPVAGVYIQPDLTIVVPGPLSATDEAALAELAVPEQLGVASMLRVSDASLSAAFERGMTADQARELLTSLTLTGIPQPLDYLITSLSERAGSIVVAAHEGSDARTSITFARPDLRSTVLVDRRLAHLQLQDAPPATSQASEPGPLFSRLRSDHVLAALLDARYPAVSNVAAVATAAAAADPDNASVGPSAVDTAFRSATEASRATSPATEAGPSAANPLDALIDRVQASLATGPTDISRQVTLAIRDRTPLVVTVEVRGDRRDFHVVPVSLAAGRVRALDEAAGVQRTLPLDAITSVSTIPQAG